MNTIAIIPSGGVGSRFNSPIPKQYVKVLGKELICYTLNVFQNCKLIDEIIIPANESYFDLLNQIKIDNNFSKISKIIKGGEVRQDSVYNGLSSKNFKYDDTIIVHDAARPLISDTLLESALLKSKKSDSLVVAIKARDTLIKSDKSIIDHLDRSDIYYVQTPQIFKYNVLKKAFELAIENNFYGTDESMLVTNAGFEVEIFDGEFKNFKITTKSDIETFEKLIK